MIPYAKQFIFLFWGNFWCYNAVTKVGLRRVAYNPWTDICVVRVSNRGQNKGLEEMERTAFEMAFREAYDSVFGWKVIASDNLAREHIADKLIVGNMHMDDAKIEAARLNDKALAEEGEPFYWHRAVPRNYRLSRGMEDLV